MSKRSLSIILIISLAFNLAVLGSLLWLNLSRPERPPAYKSRTHYPRLPEHIAPCERDPAIARSWEQFEHSKIELMQELRQDPIDEPQIMSIIESSIQAQSKLESHLGTRLLTLRKQMTAAEAEAYFGARIKHMQERKDHKPHPRRIHHEENTTD